MLKRLFDILVSSVLIILLLPMMMFAGLLVFAALGRPVLFRQIRPGINGSPFTLYKFRTMLDTHDNDGKPLPDEQRLTRTGLWLRRTSLDELPQLINVILGDMSLVGPRPLLMEYIPLYTPQQARRHEVRPGITGWAQVNGRNLLSWDKRFDFDVWYVDHANMKLDLKILWMTLKNVFSANGVSADNHVTMPKFAGSSNETEHE